MPRLTATMPECIAPPAHRHTAYGYGTYGCRCAGCKAAAAESRRDYAERRRRGEIKRPGRPPKTYEHGTTQRARQGDGCDCIPCRAALARYRLRAKRVERTGDAAPPSPSHGSPEAALAGCCCWRCRIATNLLRDGATEDEVRVRLVKDRVLRVLRKHGAIHRDVVLRSWWHTIACADLLKEGAAVEGGDGFIRLVGMRDRKVPGIKTSTSVQLSQNVIIHAADDEEVAPCWCRTEFLPVKRALLARGITKACGREVCVRMATRKRAT